MTVPLSENNKTRLTLAATGLVQGFVYYLAYEFWPEDPARAALTIAPVFLVSVAAVIIHLSWTGSHIRRLATVATITSVVFAVLAVWVWLQIPGDDALYREDELRIPTLIMGTAIAVYVLLPFIQIYQRTGQREYPYVDLFRHSWNNCYILAIGALLVGAFWSIILLWFELFKLIDVTFFEDVFTHAAFVTMSLTTVFGYGVALGREREKITNTLRLVTIAVFKTLMPLLAFISLLFLVALPFTGLQPLWDTGHASAVLLSLIGVTILFLNGVYQDGTGEVPYDPRVRMGVAAAIVVLPVFAAITLYALSLRIDQYGLTPPRFYGVLIALVAAVYTVGYAIAVFIRRGSWMQTIQRVNMGMAWVLVACVIAVHSPLLDPLSMSADGQYNRLAREEVDAAEFDYGYMRFQLGQAGYAKLGELEQLSEHPQIDIIVERIAATRAADSYREVLAQPTVLLTVDEIESLYPGQPLPDDLVQSVALNLTAEQTRFCKGEDACLIAPIALDGDNEFEYILVLSGPADFDILAFDRDGAGEWQRIGMMRRIGEDTELPDREAFLDSLRTHGAVPAEIPWRDLEIGGIVLRLDERRE